MAEKIVVASGKGGVGKSTCVVGLAVALCNLNKKVLMVDFDVSLASLDVIFGVSRQVFNNWGDIVLERCSAKEAMIEKNGVSLLSAPRTADDRFSSKKIKEMIASFDKDFDYILIDSPAGIGQFFEIAVKCADRGIVVSNADDVCVRSAGIAAARMRELGLEDIRLIINKMIVKFSLKRKNLNIDNVIDATLVRLIGVIPYNEKIGLISMENRELFLKKEPMKSFERIARRITGEEVELKIWY